VGGKIPGCLKGLEKKVTLTLLDKKIPGTEKDTS